MATYSYTQYIDEDRLSLEIRNSNITIALNEVVITGENTADVFFKNDLPSVDKGILDELIADHINQPITVRDSVDIANVGISKTQKALTVAATKQEGSSTHIISHDFTDKTTWYTESVRVDNVVLTSTDNLTFTSNHLNWINLTSGKVPYEHRLSRYFPVIKVNGAIVTPDVSIDHNSGAITFANPQTGTITADYSYAEGSTWVLKPSVGKVLKLEGTAVKFTNDVEIGEDQSMVFQLYIGGNSYGSPTVYNNIKDFVKCAMGEVSVTPSFGDLLNEVITIPFDYITSKDLDSSIGMEVRIKIPNDTPITGEFGVISARCVSIDK